MMKKRIIAIVAVFAMSLCGFALAACSDNTEKYAVTYNANGGYFADIGTSIRYEKVEKGGYATGDDWKEDKRPTPNDATLEFKGWGVSSDSKTVIKLNAYPIMSDTEFFAIWGKEEPPTAQHAVTFYYNYEGSQTDVFTTKYVDNAAAVEAPSPAPSRGEAYTFDGWFTQAEGGSLYNFSAAVTSNLSLYAHWTEVTVDPGEPQIIAIQISQQPTKTEYVKGQAFNKAGLIVRALYSGGKAPTTLSSTDYTVSTPDMSVIGPQTVTVSYDNDGTTLTDTFTINIVEKAVTSLVIGGDLKNKQQEVGAVFNPAGLTFTAHYNDGDTKKLDVSDITFASTLLDETGAFTDEGEAQITATYDGVTSATKTYVTVYKPEETKYNVEFMKNNTVYANSITGMPATQRVVENEMAKQPTAPKLKGFTFGGWYTDAACTTAFSFTRAITANTKLYAKWEAIIYTVDYKLNGGENNRGNRNSYSANLDGEFESVDLLDPSKGHNEFGGWFFDKEYETSTTALSYSNVTEYAVKDGTTYTVTLYAKFTPEEYAIAYEWGAANNTDYKAEFVDGYTAPAKYTYGEGVDLPDADDVKITVLKAGEAVEFNFLGWYIKGDATKTHITSIPSTAFDKKTVVADIVQAAAYNFTYDYNYTGSTATVKKVIKDGYASALSSAPTRAGYTFDKWYTTKEGGTEFDFENTPITQNTTVYAGWTAIEYTVSYIGLPTGTTNGNATKYTVEDGENGTVTLEDPTDLPDGYRFFGWYSDNKYKTEKTVIVPADIASADEKVITVYAKCNNLYTVTFNENIIEAAVTDMPADIEGVTYGDGIESPTKTPACANYTFGGWYVDKECTTEWIFTDGEGTATLVKPTADDNYKCEVYAKWIENPDSGVYLFGTPNGSDIHHTDIADYKVEVTEEGGVKTYTIGNLDLEVGTSFKLINYTQSTGDMTWIPAAATVVVHPQAGMTVSKTSDGNYKVGAVSIENATLTLVVSNGRADFTLEIEGGYIGLRAP
ncbi:MAG: InlB B-repeat-containing protein, partial [Clostridiales bacterium]|nr:InlB B-repeat-containing protein [Clostridiales bacterium]